MTPLQAYVGAYLGVVALVVLPLYLYLDWAYQSYRLCSHGARTGLVLGGVVAIGLAAVAAETAARAVA